MTIETKTFSNFLRDNDAHENYLRAINGTGWSYSPDLEPEDFILSAFTWVPTKEGHDYWSDLNKKWQAEVDSWGR
jgi:hypothetical protein